MTIEKNCWNLFNITGNGVRTSTSKEKSKGIRKGKCQAIKTEDKTKKRTKKAKPKCRKSFVMETDSE